MAAKLHEIPEATRLAVLERDGYRCVYCYERAETVDHVLPQAYRVDHGPDNLVAACYRCNQLVGARVFVGLAEKLAYVRASLAKARPPLMQLVCSKCGERYTRLGENRITCPRCGNVVDLDILTQHGLLLESESEDDAVATSNEQVKSVPAKRPTIPKERLPPVPAAVLDEALRGRKPQLDHEITMEELGERLAKFRRGRYPDQAFTKQAISLYRSKAEQQSNDFIEAFYAWRAAEISRQDQLRARFNIGHLNEMLHEQGYIEQLGPDPVKALLLVGQLPAHRLIHVNGVASAVECTAEIVTCGCGCGCQQRFVRRSWNQKRCAGCRGGRCQGRVKE